MTGSGAVSLGKAIEQLNAQGGQQGFDLGEPAALARSRFFQHTAQDHRLGRGAILSLAADDECAIEY